MPEYAAYIAAVVAIEGTVDMAARLIDIEGRPLDTERPQERLEQLAIAA